MENLTSFFLFLQSFIQFEWTLLITYVFSQAKSSPLDIGGSGKPAGLPAAASWYSLSPLFPLFNQIGISSKTLFLGASEQIYGHHLPQEFPKRNLKVSLVLQFLRLVQACHRGTIMLFHLWQQLSKNINVKE